MESRKPKKKGLTKAPPAVKMKGRPKRETAEAKRQKKRGRFKKTLDEKPLGE
jgi:hypothetical protein